MMVRRAVAWDRQGWLGRRFLLAYLLVVTLLLGHQLVMATARHADSMVMGQGWSMLPAVSTQIVTALAGDPIPSPTPGDQQPPTGLEECFSQVGVLPVLLLLLIIAALWRRSTSAAPIDRLSEAGRRVAHFLHPPPLAPSRRRALLQVFLN